ncbi:MAG TPA: amidohydrolase [Flavobacteriales bacterium]|nr:amidohydrolase [Flavobacteriales bacterium]HRE73555.1 amidohydrolase [Flavobacteriales bacterium]HRE97171.1 amidohydrolase [Flavobacteriales bacterium]HRJ34492.1 amidohydrolase [Flavobacteriales bacterium]HRJ37312.1 amidohydrolase [Flavobacteriales bacterium]
MGNTNELKVCIVQTELDWENPEANRMRFDRLLQNVQADLIVLPEMFSTGFSMQPEKLAEAMSGDTVQWMLTTARKKNAVLTGSVIIKAEDQYVNRLLWINPSGTIEYYDKRHLFRMGNEHEHYSAGSTKIFPEVKGWRICPLICYDLRFPVWSRNSSPFYDVLIYVANWPELRREPWMTLLSARAIENQSYVVGVNRIGTDGRGIAHSGDSCVMDAKGMRISSDSYNCELVETVLLKRNELLDFREKFPVLLDGDDFSIR